MLNMCVFASSTIIVYATSADGNDHMRLAIFAAKTAFSKQRRTSTIYPSHTPRSKKQASNTTLPNPIFAYGSAGIIGGIKLSIRETMRASARNNPQSATRLVDN